MESKKNTCGDMMNDKFIGLLSADMDGSWKAMKATLDKEMPEKKKRKLIIWFLVKASIGALVLFALFASATGIYNIINQRKLENKTNPLKNKALELKAESRPGINEDVLNKATTMEYVHTEVSSKNSRTLVAESKNRKKIRVEKTDTRIVRDEPVVVKEIVLPEQKKDTVEKIISIVPPQAKDSVLSDAPKVDGEKKKRGF